MRRLVIRVTLAVCALGLLLAPRAQAEPSRFQVIRCQKGVGPVDVAFIQHGFAPSFHPSNNDCANGGYLDIASEGTGNATLAEYSVGGKTPGGYNSAIEFTASARFNCDTSGSTLRAYYAYVDGTLQADCSGNWHTYTVPGATVVGLVLDCPGFFDCPGNANVSGTDFTIHTVDPHPPVITSEGGSLLDPGTLRGQQDLGVGASDQGGGVADVILLVNGQAAPNGDRPQTCATAAQQAVSFSPCPGTANINFNVNTEAPPFHDGANEIVVCVSDYATESAPQQVCSGQPIEVDNSCAGSAVAGGKNLSLAFKQTESDTAVVMADDPATATGKLTDGFGDPVRGATLCVKERTLAPGEPDADVATVRTDKEGEYSYTVAPGPSRRIRVGYRFNRTEIGHEGKYLAHTAATLSIKPRKTRNRKKIRIWGAIPGPHNGNRVVVLQARYPHSKQWKTFEQAQTDADGRYETSYRFTATYRTTKYRFRTLVPSQDGYPYLQGASKVRRVTVRGD